MQEETITVTVTKTTLTTVADCVGLLEWSQTVPGVAVAVSARTDGQIVVQAEGDTVDTVYAELGDTIMWDGARFTVTSGEVN